MKIRTVRSDDCKAQAKALSVSASINLYFLEKAIAANPDAPEGFDVQRLVIAELDDLDVTTVESGSLFVAYHPLGDGLVSIDMVLDRRQPPAWYRRP